MSSSPGAHSAAEREMREAASRAALLLEVRGVSATRSSSSESPLRRNGFLVDAALLVSFFSCLFAGVFTGFFGAGDFFFFSSSVTFFFLASGFFSSLPSTFSFIFFLVPLSTLLLIFFLVPFLSLPPLPPLPSALPGLLRRVPPPPPRSEFRTWRAWASVLCALSPQKYLRWIWSLSILNLPPQLGHSTRLGDVIFRKSASRTWYVVSTTSYFFISSLGVSFSLSGPWYVQTFNVPSSSVNLAISVLHWVSAMTGQMTNVPALAPPSRDRSFFGTLSNSISADQSPFPSSHSRSSR
mmetsp:Transcript_7414/g.16174  ORF Transcript_7414/g.16174 Transcript_7414/m.16174 type:complete len:296 (+) Transcript_7414:2085-2972(+)